MKTKNVLTPFAILSILTATASIHAGANDDQIAASCALLSEDAVEQMSVLRQTHQSRIEFMAERNASVLTGMRDGIYSVYSAAHLQQLERQLVSLETLRAQKNALEASIAQLDTVIRSASRTTSAQQSPEAIRHRSQIQTNQTLIEQTNVVLEQMRSELSAALEARNALQQEVDAKNNRLAQIAALPQARRNAPRIARERRTITRALPALQASLTSANQNVSRLQAEQARAVALVNTAETAVSEDQSALDEILTGQSGHTAVSLNESTADRARLQARLQQLNTVIAPLENSTNAVVTRIQHLSLKPTGSRVDENQEVTYSPGQVSVTVCRREIVQNTHNEGTVQERLNLNDFRVCNTMNVLDGSITELPVVKWARAGETDVNVYRLLVGDVCANLIPQPEIIVEPSRRAVVAAPVLQPAEVVEATVEVESAESADEPAEKSSAFRYKK